MIFVGSKEIELIKVIKSHLESFCSGNLSNFDIK
jgi:hypothetical protein